MYAILFLSLSLIFVVFTSADCPVKLCEWLPWGPWSECSRPCAGGTRWRERTFCCKGELADDLEACMNYCNHDSSYFYNSRSETGFCNQFCYKGGTFIQHTRFYQTCKCHGFTYGVCCEKGAYLFVEDKMFLTEMFLHVCLSKNSFKFYRPL